MVVVRPWSSLAARNPLAWAAGVVVTALGLWRGALAYRDAIADGAWTGATLIIPIAPTKAVILGLVAYATARALVTAWRGAGRPAERWGGAAALVAFSTALAFSEVTGTISAARERLAGSKDLTSAQVAAIAARVADGRADDGEITAFLANSACPADFLTRFADGGRYERAAVARNPATPGELIVRRSRDPDVEVRIQAIGNPRLPESELPRLGADSDPRIREMAVWKKNLPDPDFRKLLTNPDESVRSTVALQGRLTDDELRVLLRDSSEQVRTAAERTAARRGLE